MNSSFVKLVVFVPEAYADSVRKAMGDAGAGKLGTYTHCTFSTKGTGRFIPQEGSDPYDGEIGQLNSAEEERIETVCPRDTLTDVMQAIKQAHPYEEVPIDVYPLEELPA